MTDPFPTQPPVPQPRTEPDAEPGSGQPPAPATTAPATSEAGPSRASALGEIVLATKIGPTGERVGTRASADATATLVWNDGSPDTDVTATFADLLLLGWVETSRELDAPTPPTETVNVGGLRSHGTWEVYVQDGAGDIYQLTDQTIEAWAAAAVAALITSGVAYEATHDDDDDSIPDTPADLTPPTSTAPEADQ